MSVHLSSLLLPSPHLDLWVHVEPFIQYKQLCCGWQQCNVCASLTSAGNLPTQDSCCCRLELAQMVSARLSAALECATAFKSEVQDMDRAGGVCLLKQTFSGTSAGWGPEIRTSQKFIESAFSLYTGGIHRDSVNILALCHKLLPCTGLLAFNVSPLLT